MWTLAPGTSAPALAQWAGGHGSREEMGRKAAVEPPPTLSQLSTVGSPSRPSQLEEHCRKCQTAFCPARQATAPFTSPFLQDSASFPWCSQSQWGMGGKGESPCKIEKSQFPPFVSHLPKSEQKRTIDADLGNTPSVSLRGRKRDGVSGPLEAAACTAGVPLVVTYF